MTWHQWHQTAPMSRRMGLSSDLTRAKAASPHSCQSMGWWAAERRYGLTESFSRFSGCDDKRTPHSAKGPDQNRIWTKAPRHAVVYSSGLLLGKSAGTPSKAATGPTER